MPLAKDTERIARLRENKRRYRERQREYINDLEKRLRELQQRGIQATIEVQTAAKIVAEENRQLRILLTRQFGMTDDAIGAWIRTSRVIAGSKNSIDDDDSASTCNNGGSQCQASSSKAAVVASSNCSSQSQPQKRRCSEVREARNSQPRNLPTDEMAVLEEIPQEDGCYASIVATNPSPEVSETHGNSQLGNSAVDQARTLRHSTAPLEDILEIPQQKTPPPCKLLSRLTTDDTAQAIALTDDEMDPVSTEDGVSCSTAYNLLRRHATSEEKIDALARVLEGGCAPDSKGGCKVKHKIVAEALVDMCL